jgi:hypothetical protein
MLFCEPLPNLCKTQLYPYYRAPTFDFKLHLVGDQFKAKLLQQEYDQGLRNYRSFGDVLCLFLHTTTTVTEELSPKAYLHLLSICDVQDGFQILRDLVFSLSPQLSGDYYDYRVDIAHLSIQPGEHLSKFYQRTIQLSTEITLANIPNGGMAELALQFLTLLRTTECPTLIGILTPYWKAINNHRRDPKHLTKPLPWTFKEVYDDLINSNITVLSKNKARDETLLTDPIVAKGSSTVGIHHTKGGRHFLTIRQTNNTRPSSGDQTIGALSQQKAPCKLCLNKHPNPWHSENNCPYKHLTHIIPKDVRERVMQHNALHGAENKAYSKNQDTPSDTKKPPLAAVHSAIIALLRS